VSGLTGGGRVFIVTGGMGCGSVGLIELFGAVRAVEFMPLAGNGNQGNSHEQEREKFHRAAS
jgi:hypothetical protein